LLLVAAHPWDCAGAAAAGLRSGWCSGPGNRGRPRYYRGQRYLTDTPRGDYEIYRQVHGWDPGPLGRLYQPKYFNRQGIAIHGYASVPPHPASHGCVRVSLAAMEWICDHGRLPIGTHVKVY
jgi:N-acetylmuramoyl-L-alanine amidase